MTDLVLGALDPAATAPFDRDSVIRRVVGEPIVHALYPRALVMELAHPAVAAAVAQHSQFQQRPLRRLWATTDAAIRLIFADGDEPMAAARKIYRLHDRIHGELPVAGTSGQATYTAHDTSLLLWVWATLVDTCDVAFPRWVRPWHPGEADAFYQDMRRFAVFFGIGPGLVPLDRPAFARYRDQMLAGDALATTATTFRLVREVLWFRSWFSPGPLMSAVRVLNVGTLDPGLASRLGIELTASERELFGRIDRGLRVVYPRLPPGRARLPYHYLQPPWRPVRKDSAARFGSERGGLTG